MAKDVTQQGGANQQRSGALTGPQASAAEALMVRWVIPPPDPVDTAADLRLKRRVTVAFPPCADELLSMVHPNLEDYRAGKGDDIARSFSDYFTFDRHHTLGQIRQNNKTVELDTLIGPALDRDLADCHATVSFDTTTDGQRSLWPSDCCICEPCVTLNGYRTHATGDKAPPMPSVGIRRLFIGDALWLFYYHQMGVPQILGAILDAFAVTGRLPISNGSFDTDGVDDNIVAMILEIMVRQAKSGDAPGVRDTSTLFRTALGWNTKVGAALNVDSEVNSGFSSLFHRFIFNALEFYRDRRLAVAIQSQAVPNARPSVATLITLQNTIDVLKKRFEPFNYGRNYYNTLAGIVWVISAMSVVRQLRGTIGIPTAYGDPHEFIPAAYDLLVLKRPVTRGDVNRYSVHRDCAVNGRDILLDLEVLAYDQPGKLEAWLTQVEPKIEAYRTAYRNLTGVDIGGSASPPIEHQVPAMA